VIDLPRTLADPVAMIRFEFQRFHPVRQGSIFDRVQVYCQQIREVTKMTSDIALALSTVQDAALAAENAALLGVDDPDRRAAAMSKVADLETTLRVARPSQIAIDAGLGW
jgi:hypothetical protein